MSGKLQKSVGTLDTNSGGEKYCSQGLKVASDFLEDGWVGGSYIPLESH
jgi:hypothetical protein